MGYYSTQNVEIGHTHYCSYCGKKLDADPEYDGRDLYKNWYYCDCVKAKAEKEMQDKIEEIQTKYRGLMNRESWQIEEEYKKNFDLKIDRNFIEQIKYNHELNCLNKKYGK